MYGVIIGFDIERYSSSERTDELQEKRSRLNRLVCDAIADIPVYKKREAIDTGDGGFLLIETGNYDEVLKGLVKICAAADQASGLRFRAVVHVGKYTKDQKLFGDESGDELGGYVGNGIIVASRNLDSTCLKELLKLNPRKNCVFGISNEFYQQVFDQNYVSSFRFVKFGFQVKDYHNLIFLQIDPSMISPAVERILDRSDYVPVPRFWEFLTQSDFSYQKESLTTNLDTFYVYPDFFSERPESKTARKASSWNVLASFLENPRNLLIAGDDQTGKTSFCKKFYQEVLKAGEFLPVLLRFSADERGSLEQKVSDAVQDQYGKRPDDSLQDRIVVLIMDDFHRLDLVYQRRFLEYLKGRKNTYAIATVDSIFTGSIEKRKITEDFRVYALAEFGHSLRKQLVDLWIEFNCLTDPNYCTSDELIEYLDNTFLKGIIPFTPFYILTVLAARSDFVPLNGDLTSKGHCYQALIYISLRKMGIPENEIGAFLNIFSNIAYYFFKNSIRSFSEEQLSVFLAEYDEKYNIPFEIKYFIRHLHRGTVFCKNSIGQYAFFASYFYHYFVSKYIAEHLSSNLNEIAHIYNNLHVQANAYIGIFIVHHSKDIKVIEEVLLNTMVLYDGYIETNLSKDEMHHIDELATRLNAEVIEEYDRSDDNRSKMLISRDQEDDGERERESEAIQAELVELNKAIRTIEVVGHILKNHSGEIEKQHLRDCYVNAINAYRRICTFFIDGIKKSEQDYVAYVVDRINKVKENSWTREKVIDFAHSVFSFFNLSTIYATIKRSADALGSKGMLKIIKEVARDLDNPFAYCVYLQCEMWYRKELPIEDAAKMYKEFPVAVQHVVQRLLKEYTDLHHVEYKEKQQIASLFGMKLKALEYDYEK